MKIPIVALLTLVFAGCTRNEPEQVLCTMEARSSFAITVLDSLSGESLAPAATVQVSENAVTDTLMPSPSPNGIYSGGVYERPGVYDVTVTHEGYESWRMTDVEVDSDECHVITRTLTARLVPRT